MLGKNNNGFIKRDLVSDRYFKIRQLDGKAGSFLLWGLGVGAVIGGEFFGWNYGLAVGGFSGLVVATILMAIMYICLVYSLAEMSTMFPYTGGFYAFTRSAFGSFWGFLCGAIVSIEFVVTVATIVVGVSSYLEPILPNVPNYIIWLCTYIIFVTINSQRVEISLTISLFLCLMSIMVLCLFFGTATFSEIFRPELLFNIAPEPEKSPFWLPFGWKGVFAAIPYAIWFYLAIEGVPLAAEESEKPSKNIPKALIVGMYTLIVLSFLVLVLNTGVGGGAEAMGKSNLPLGDGLEVYYSTGYAINIALLCGVLSTVQSITHAYGRSIYALSRAGYIPRWISVTGKNHTPYRALILGGVIGYICVLIIGFSQSAIVGQVLLNMSVFGAVISYIMVMSGYIKLKIKHPKVTRPYKSPLGIIGAGIGVILSFVALLACCAVPAYQPGVIGMGIAIALSAIYYFTYSRHHIVARSPEEQAALNLAEAAEPPHSI
jgi:ethanolamine permease